MPALFKTTKIHVTRHDQTVHVILRGELDHDDTEDLYTAWQMIDQLALPATTVALAQVLFADSMLLNALLDAHRRHHTTGRALTLLGPLPPSVHRLLDVTGTLGVFTIRDTDSTPPTCRPPHSA
ncbi:STAS domain-containing protein [Streptomyces sp. NPDC093516]|uniref:STAS domain-containing protein n=1 Tax=unclassified Streptomyces TaxID=2593676 RepID=UPI00344A8D1E